MYDIEHYLTPEDGADPYIAWLTRLRNNPVRARIIRRVSRMELGNFGDHRFCRDGVWELRIDFGPGYRLYYAIAGRRVVLLLCGGDKRAQAADIDKAVHYWKDWSRRRQR